MKLRICKNTGRLDDKVLEKEDLNKLLHQGVITRGETGGQIKFYASPFIFSEIVQNPTLNQLFGEHYVGWKHGTFNPTKMDLFSHNEIDIDGLRSWIELKWPR
jgi:hypothetical protein